MKSISLFLTLCFWGCAIVLPAQDTQVSVLNGVITHLIGPQDNLDIPVYETIGEVCKSDYISCDSDNNIIGLNFQFANLNGHIPESLVKLTELEWINLEYNYLSGVIPDGLSELKYLEELLLNGNFITGPLPNDLAGISKSVLVDLSQNVIDEVDDKLIRNLKIVNQVNLEGCRSPDSIFISKAKNGREGFELAEILIDKDSIKTQTQEDDSKEKLSDEVEIFKVVETMPRFPGCEMMDISDSEKENCGKEKMLQFIYRNLRYPTLGINNNVEGMAVVQFVILEDGSVADVGLIRDPGDRLGNSAIWIVNRMNYICDKWIPGNQDGKDVTVDFTLPIRFKLEG